MRHRSPYHRHVLCRELIGREPEVDRLRTRIADLADARGGVLVLVGDAGAGKSRLVADVTAGIDATVLAGRAVPGGSPVPYRPLAEAFLAVSRGRPLPSDPSLRGFERQLGRLAPSWSDGATAEDSPLLLAEAVVRLLGALADGRSIVLLLEDIHWSDAETLAVIDYLADALHHEPVLCICTTRPNGAADDVLARLKRRDPGAIVNVDRLGAADVTRMVAACLQTTDLPAGLSDFVGLHSEGNPFLVEELLAGLAAVDALRYSGGPWEITGQLTPAIPASLRDSILRRLAVLDPTTRRVLGAAALLGRSFEWELLPGIADVDGRAAVDALRAAVTEQLIETDGDGFRFRHALTREAVLADLLPPERRDLGARAWPAIQRAKPGLPGAACQLAADLAEAAGDAAAASGLLVESARRALASGAMATAEATARRARELAAKVPARALDADEILVDVLAAAGKPGRAMTLGRDVAERLAAAGAPAKRRADFLLVLARAAIAAGDLATADRAVTEARAAAGTGADRALLARIDAVATEVALDRADLVAAEQLGWRAVEEGRATDQPEVVCEALLLLGRLARPAGQPTAIERFQQAADTAAAAGLPRWQLRVQHELALEAWATRGGEAIRETRDLAARIGAYLTVAVMDLSLADFALTDYDRTACLEAATACVEASHRYELATEPVAQLWLAGAHALSDDDAAMRAAIEAALARDPDDPRILADLYGRVLVTQAFVRDELDRLPGLLDVMIQHVRRAPTAKSIYPGRVLWALLHAVDDDDLGVQARREYHDAVGRLGMPLFEHFGKIIEAVALGRSGASTEATSQMQSAYATIVSTPLGQGLARPALLIVARAAIRDGWGEPTRWLRECEAWFAERGYDRPARRCRTLLREAGAPVPRRGRGDSEVPGSLRALGVTSREVDVLKLVVAGRSTKEIAAALFLSPKTVERHLTSLFARTGVSNRRALAELGVVHLS
jgi:DNA-binding CsgD family transcriptional regulator